MPWHAFRVPAAAHRSFCEQCFHRLSETVKHKGACDLDCEDWDIFLFLLGSSAPLPPLPIHPTLPMSTCQIKADVGASCPPVIQMFNFAWMLIASEANIWTMTDDYTNVLYISCLCLFVLSSICKDSNICVDWIKLWWIKAMPQKSFFSTTCALVVTTYGI